jgi:hypothetical protein
VLAEPDLPPDARDLPFKLAIALTVDQMRTFSAQEQVHSYRKVHTQDPASLPISGKAALETCLARTAFGLPRRPHHPGGADTYICQEDAQISKESALRQRPPEDSMDHFRDVSTCGLRDHSGRDPIPSRHLSMS